MPITLLAIDIVGLATNPLVIAIIVIIILIHLNSQTGIKYPVKK
ncbi:MAG: hypothetical protein V1722_02405 [Candidatus Micrarchaeota archaeon]